MNGVLWVLKMIFKLKDGAVVTQHVNNSVLNELMFSMMAQNASNTNSKTGKKINMKIEDLKSVEIIF